MPTFRQVYCSDHQCPEDRFVERVLTETLHLRARILRPFLVALKFDFFAPDLDLIESLAEIVHTSEIEHELADFVTDDRNRSWLRGRLRLRISTRKLRNLVRGSLPHHQSRRSPAPDSRHQS